MYQYSIIITVDTENATVNECKINEVVFVHYRIDIGAWLNNYQ